jgi:hypothetical protein
MDRRARRPTRRQSRSAHVVVIPALAAGLAALAAGLAALVLRGPAPILRPPRLLLTLTAALAALSSVLRALSSVLAALSSVLSFARPAVLAALLLRIIGGISAAAWIALRLVGLFWIAWLSAAARHVDVSCFHCSGEFLSRSRLGSGRSGLYRLQRVSRVGFS